MAKCFSGHSLSKHGLETPLFVRVYAVLCTVNEHIVFQYNNNNNNNNNNNDLLSVFPYNGSSPDKTTTTISKEIVRKL
jgi:hypothetical protein